MDVLQTQVVELLTSYLGRAPTDAEVEQGLLAPQSLANVHNTLNSAQSTLSITSSQDIQEAMDKLEANGGGILVLTPGTYELDNDLNVPSNVTMEGTNRDTVIVDFGGGIYSIRLYGEDVYDTGTIDASEGDITIIGNGTDWTEDMVGQTIWLGSQYYTIGSFTTPTQLEMDSAFVDDTVSGASYAIATPNTGSQLRNLTIQNSSAAGVDVAYSTQFIFYNINIFTCETGLKATWSTFPIIDAPSFEENEINVDFTDCNGYTISGALIGGSTVGEGIKLTRSGNASIFNTEVSGNATDGLRLVDSGGISFSSLSVNGNINDGIVLVSGSSGCQIAQANIGKNGEYGINIANASSEDNIILGNVFDANTSGEVNDSGTGTLIRSNVGEPDN